MTKRLLALLVLSAIGAHGWSDKGHKMVPDLALKSLPADVPVLRAYSATVVDAGPEPDRWRGGRPPIKDAQEPDHFIHLDQAAFLNPFPPTRHKFIEAVYAEAARTASALRPEALGYQPYIVVEVYERLRVAFGEYARLRLLKLPTREAERRIAFYAGWLSHYVADGAQPLHVTEHYDGWVGANPDEFTTERGIHARFESTFVEENISAADVAALPAKRVAVGDPLADYLAYLRESAGLVRRLYELDKAGAFTGPGTAEGRRFVTERLAAGRDVLAALWQAAWQQSRWEGCITFTEAPSHTTRVGCVTGTVWTTRTGTGGAAAAASTAAAGRGPLWLSFCRDTRDCALSILIPAGARDRFPGPEALDGKAFNFVGLISSFGTRPVMVLTERGQIRPPR